MDVDAETPLVPPNRKSTLYEMAEELVGDLYVPNQPEVSSGHADIYHGAWISPQGEQVEVAVKELKTSNPKDGQTDPEALKRNATHVKRELSIWTRTEHPNLHPLLGYRSEPRPRLISPWCHNGNLTRYLQNNSNLSRLDKLRLLFQAACGLEHLHAQNPPICQADIKPENVLINDRYCAALTDFGLGRVLESFGRPSGLTTTDGPKGTFNYMASELFTEEKPRPSLETDVYAFGGLILTVMSGKIPFHDLPESAILFRITHDRPPKPQDHQDLPPSDSLWNLISRCWNITPGARPPMREVLRELWGDICKEEFDRFSRPNLLSVAPDNDPDTSNMDIDGPVEPPAGGISSCTG